MKKIKILIFLLGLTICNCNKNILKKKTQNTDITFESTCPQDGDCSVKIIKNKQLIIKNDDTGALYYETQHDEKTSVIIYEYNKKDKTGFQDGSFIEEVIFEIYNTNAQLNLVDKELQQTKMLYGRHCFCKGKAGYFKIKSGKLDFKKLKNKINFNLDFKIIEVPQTIKNLRIISK